MFLFSLPFPVRKTAGTGKSGYTWTSSNKTSVTTSELTECLTDKIVRHNRNSNNRLRKFTVTSGTQTKGNVDIRDSLLTHSQEEADSCSYCML